MLFNNIPNNYITVAELSMRVVPNSNCTDKSRLSLRDAGNNMYTDAIYNGGKYYTNFTKCSICAEKDTKFNNQFVYDIYTGYREGGIACNSAYEREFITREEFFESRDTTRKIFVNSDKKYVNVGYYMGRDLSQNSTHVKNFSQSKNQTYPKNFSSFSDLSLAISSLALRKGFEGHFICTSYVNGEPYFLSTVSTPTKDLCEGYTKTNEASYYDGIRLCESLPLRFVCSNVYLQEKTSYNGRVLKRSVPEVAVSQDFSPSYAKQSDVNKMNFMFSIMAIFLLSTVFLFVYIVVKKVKYKEDYSKINNMIKV